MPLTPEDIAVVKATAPVVAENALKITSTFYKMLFENNPETLAFFNKSHQKEGRQPRALADAVVAYAVHIENLDAVVPLVNKIAARHCALSVKPEHYGIVHTNLMAAIAEVLGDAVTPEIATGWSNSVLALAEICIAAEEEIYKAVESRKGGWRYEREFELAAKEIVAEDTVRFEFKPTDGSTDGFEFTPGQYLTVRVPDVGAPRHYTVVSAPGAATLEVATRLVSGGEMSTHMHEKLNVGDKVLLAAPMGVFGVPEDAEKVVLVSAGIGITPMVSFLNALPKGKVVAAAHVDKRAERHAFKEAFEAAELPFYEAAYSSGTERPDLAALASKLVASAGADATYMVCGPTTFMEGMDRELRAQGVDRVEMEVFGTGTVKTNKEAAAAARPGSRQRPGSRAKAATSEPGASQVEEKAIEG